MAIRFKRGSLLWRLSERHIPLKGFRVNRRGKMTECRYDRTQKDSVEDERESPSFNPTSLNGSGLHLCSLGCCAIAQQPWGVALMRDTRWLLLIDRFPWIDMATISSVERRWEERKGRGNTVGGLVSTHRTDIEIDTVP